MQGFNLGVMHAIAAGRPSYVSGIKSAGDSLNMKSHDLIIRKILFMAFISTICLLSVLIHNRSIPFWIDVLMHIVIVDLS